MADIKCTECGYESSIYRRSCTRCASKLENPVYADLLKYVLVGTGMVLFSVVIFGSWSLLQGLERSNSALTGEGYQDEYSPLFALFGPSICLGPMLAVILLVEIPFFVLPIILSAELSEQKRRITMLFAISILVIINLIIIWFMAIPLGQFLQWPEGIRLEWSRYLENIGL